MEVFNLIIESFEGEKIGRDILKIENLSEYKHHNQWKAYHVLPAQERLQPLYFKITKVYHGLFLFEQVLILIQDPAHINNYVFPAMA